MKEIGNTNTTKAKATRVSVYTIQKYTLTNTSHTFQIKQQQQVCRTDKYKNAHTQALAIKFSRRRDHETSALRTFCRLKSCVYKRSRQSKQQSVVFQSTLCEVAVA